MQFADRSRAASRRALRLDVMGGERDRILAQIGMSSLRDLTDFPPLVGARVLMARSTGRLSRVDHGSYLVDDFAGRDLQLAPGWPLAALRGMDDRRALAMAKIGINTVADLAALGDEADAAIAAASADNGFSERPSAPAALMPRIIGSVSSSVRYTSFIQDSEVRDFRYEVDTECFFPLPLSPAPKAGIEPPSLSDTFTAQHCPVIQLGYLCDHRQRWINLGTHLGEVVHSVSLAPGESRNIARVNWRRRQLTNVDQRTATNERVTGTFVQNRALEEVAGAVAQEHQQGKTRTEANTMVTAGSFVAAGAVIGGASLGVAGAVAGGVAGAAASGTTLAVVGALAGGAAGAAVGGLAGGAAGGMVFAGAQALGMIEASSEGDREVVGTMQQRITLSTSQNASAVRSIWSAAVVEDSQAESVEATASNVTNYNHMHSLNIQYYEVLQRYLTQLSVESVQPLAYVPFTFFDFTGFKFVRDYWDVVRPAIDSEDLRLAGDTYFAEDGLPAAPDLLPPPAAVAEPPPVARMRLNGLVIEVTFEAGRSGLSSAILNNMTSVDLELVRDDTSVRFEKDKDHSSRDNPGLKRKRFHFGGVPDAQLVRLVRLRRDQAIDTDIRVSVRVHEGNLDMEEGGARVGDLNGSIITAAATMRKDQEILELTWSPASDALDEHARHLALYNAYLAEVRRVADENARRTVVFEQLRRNVEKLQRLILRRRHFFTRAILSAIEPEEIVQLLEALRLRFGNGPRDLVPLNVIAHTTPLGFTAGAFVLRLKPLDDREIDRHGFGKSSSAMLKRLVTYTGALRERFGTAAREKLAVSDQVFLPTGGLFAEAVLGRSNAAEYLDVERYFNWQDAPIPNQAPAVQPVDSGSRFQAPTTQTAAAPSTINLSGPVALPDPTGMQGILTAIQNGNMFRDMSKAAELAGIVSSLASLSGQMGQAATKLTGDAQQQAMQAAAQAGQAASTLAQSMGTQAFQQAGAMGTAMANSLGSSMTQQGAMLNQAQKIDAGKAAGGGGTGAASPGAGQPGGGASPGGGGPGTGGPGGSPGGGAGPGGGTSPLDFATSLEARPSLTEDVFRRITGTSDAVTGSGYRTAAYDPTLPASPAEQVTAELWRDLITFQVPPDIVQDLRSRDMKVQRLDTAQGAYVNLDAFPVLITEMPKEGTATLTPEALLRHVRLNLNDFLWARLGEFDPYDDALDGPIWRSDNPYGAVMKIDLGGPDNAAVVCTRAAADHWIFTTAETPLLYPGTGTHPVSGQRMFGFLKGGNGEVVVYTRGADRASGALEAMIGEEVYNGGAALWVHFQNRLIEFVNSHGGEARLHRTFSKRFLWSGVQQALRLSPWWPT